MGWSIVLLTGFSARSSQSNHLVHGVGLGTGLASTDRRGTMAATRHDASAPDLATTAVLVGAGRRCRATAPDASIR